MEMDKIPYFYPLSLDTKQEIIYAMDRKTYEKGSLICKKDEMAINLFLIQAGVVEVASKYDRRREDENFVIERLTRGAIINHRSFMVKDDADTDFVCLTNVSVFMLSHAKFKEIKRKRQDLKRTKNQVKGDIYRSLYPLALDYIFHNNERNSIEVYRETLRRNELRVKFKNAIMQHWTKVKEETQPGNIQGMIDDMLKRKRASNSSG